MARHWSPLILLFLFLVHFSAAKDKKEILPEYVLEAKTVLVVIDPNAGISSSNPSEKSNRSRGRGKSAHEVGTILPGDGCDECGFDHLCPTRPW